QGRVTLSACRRTISECGPGTDTVRGRARDRNGGGGSIVPDAEQGERPFDAVLSQPRRGRMVGRLRDYRGWLSEREGVPKVDDERWRRALGFRRQTKRLGSRDATGYRSPSGGRLGRRRVRFLAAAGDFAAAGYGVRRTGRTSDLVAAGRGRSATGQ